LPPILVSNAHAGTVFVIGGALKADSDAVWQRLVDEAGGAGAPIAVFATAATDPERSAAQIVAALERCGARAEHIPVAPHLAGVDLQATLHDPALISRVAECRAVFFSGGAQELIVDTLQPGGRPTAMLGAIRAIFDAGGLIAGTSAGAAVMSRMMFRDAMDNLAILKGQWRAGQEYDRGLDFLGPDLLIDQHFLKRGRIGRMLPAMQALGYRLGLGVDENAAVVIKGSRLEVIGGSGAMLVDLGEATSDAALPAFNLRDARLSYLGSGDRHDLASGQTTPAEYKLHAARIDPASSGFEPGLQSDRYFLDILGDDCILGAMTQLLDGPLPEVRGLAYRANPRPGDAAPDLGFEFRLHRGPGLVGWCSAAPGGEDCTVLQARLDVIPVRVANPLFTPLAALPRPVVESVLSGHGGRKENGHDGSGNDQW
jgi:cyanophycinase